MFSAFTLDAGCLLPSVSWPKSGQSVYDFIYEKVYKTFRNQRHYIKYSIITNALELLSTVPGASLTLLSCSPNCPNIDV